MATAAERARGAAVATAVASTLLLLAWSMAANVAGAPVPPLWLQGCAVATNLAVTTWLLTSRPGVLPAITAVALGLAVAVPALSMAVHDTALPYPGNAAIAGSGAAVAVLAGGALRPRSVVHVAAVVGGTVVWLSLLLGVQTLADGPIDVSYERNDRDWLGVWQLKGVAGHPNALGLLCVLALVAQVGALRRLPQLPRWRVAVLWAAGPLASAVALAWSQSRTGWIAGALSLVVLVVPWQRLPRFAVPAWGLVWMAAALGPPALATWLQFGFAGRALAWSLARLAVAAWPAWGPGPDMFSGEFWRRQQTFGTYDWLPAHAHNTLLQGGVLLGVPGIAICLLAAILVFTLAARNLRRDGAAGLAAATAVAVFAGVECSLGVGVGGAVYLPAVLLALVLGAGSRRQPGSAVAQERPTVAASAAEPAEPAASGGLPFLAGTPVRRQEEWGRWAWGRYGGSRPRSPWQSWSPDARRDHSRIRHRPRPT